MPTIAEVRQKFPQYNDLSDEQLAGALHKKYYSDMSVEQFQAKIGMKQNLDPAQVPPRNPPMSFREGLAGTVGSMLNGIPVVGPALLGAGNRMAAVKHSLMEGKPYGQALEEAQTAQENFTRGHPTIANSAGTAGAASSMLVGGGTGIGARALGITGRNLATRSLASGATGAAVGGADAYARGNDPVQGAEVGGAFGAVAPAAGQAIGAGVRSMMGRGPPRIPTIDDMHTTKNWAYLTVDRLGARYNPTSYNLMMSGIRNAAKRDHISPIRHPRAISMMDDMDAARQTWANPNSPTLTELDQLRQVARRDLVQAGDDAEQHFGDLIMDHIDDFVDNAQPSQMAAGDPRAAAAAIRAARKANTQMRKAEMIEDALTRAGRRAASTGSGGNVENTIRQNIRQILDNPKRIRAFNKDEREIMERIVDPQSRGQDFLRLVGKLSPSGNGLMAAFGIGATAVNPMLGVPVAGAGIAAKMASEGVTQGRVNKLQRLVRTGGAPKPPPLTGIPSAAQRAVQAISLGGPMSLYPPLPLKPWEQVPR